MKKLAVFILICCLVMPIQVFGHSYVGSSFPNEGEKIDEPLEKIELHFDASIEKHTSVELVDETGSVVPIAEQTFEEQSLIAILEQPVYSGNYTIYWQALGSDGHTTEGTISFSVNAKEPKEAVEEKDEAIEQEEDIEVENVELEEENISVEEDQVEPEESTQENDDENRLDQSTISPTIIIIGIIAIVSIITILFRRKRL